ncbi:MAG: T9SS type A sorting domain-containing protein [Bacteroidales bacterium]|nr:T9SS type A sorting domain-containing protein [Bacteroidales bacterium]
MKNNIYKIQSLILASCVLLSINSFAVKHLVSVGNFFFNPVAVNANVGDTIRWVWSAGFHTTTSTSVPTGAATWNAPITSSNQSFEYKIALSGTYNYFCAVHGAGMSGSIAVSAGPPPMLNLQNLAILTGQNNCYDASQTITVAGAGTSFIIENGGVGTMIAGQNILFLPGTLVNQGGNLLGHITTNGQYCNPPPAAIVSGLGNDGNINAHSSKPGFTVYPNPTTGFFTILINNDLISSPVRVDVIGSLGESVLTANLINLSAYGANISGKPAGVYYIRLISGDKTETVKIVRL